MPLTSPRIPRTSPDRWRRWLAVVATTASVSHAADYHALVPLLQQHCVECHGVQEPDGGLVLETWDGLRQGGESGPAWVAGKSADSLLIKALEGTWSKTGKNQFMPPGKREHLKPAEIALFKAWIDAGAPAPATNAPTLVTELVVPKITPRVPARRAINDLAFDASNGRLAVARPDGVEIVQPETRAVVRTLTGASGPVNAVAFSHDGQFVFGAAGWPNQGGELRQWRVDSGELVRTFLGARDSLHALTLNADSSRIAAGSYDYSVSVWQVADGSVQKSIAAHQGAVVGLAFRPDGRLLASASFDRTAKLLDPVSGLRQETFGQALKELNAVAFSPDGRVLLTGGGDNRIRAYQISPDAKEGSNELLATVFAHEGAILRCVSVRMESPSPAPPTIAPSNCSAPTPGNCGPPWNSNPIGPRR